MIKRYFSIPERSTISGSGADCGTGILDEAVKAGLTSVSTYIPWAWHEDEEGMFDFNGSTCPEKDLEGWLRSCHEHGLTAL